MLLARARCLNYPAVSHSSHQSLLSVSQIGSARNYQENTLASRPQKIFCKIWRKMDGSQRSAKWLRRRPAKTTKALWPFLAEQPGEAEHWDASALPPDRQVCGKPERFQEGHSREHGRQGGEGCTACFLACARDCFIALGGCQPHTKDAASQTSLFLPHPTSPP